MNQFLNKILFFQTPNDEEPFVVLHREGSKLRVYFLNSQKSHLLKFFLRGNKSIHIFLNDVYHPFYLSQAYTIDEFLAEANLRQLQSLHLLFPIQSISQKIQKIQEKHQNEVELLFSKALAEIPF